jgi:hypothetical protein
LACLLKGLESIYVAATFAEAGEFNTARGILREDKRPWKVDRITLKQAKKTITGTLH